MTKTTTQTTEAPLQLSDLHVSMPVMALGQIGNVVAVDAGEQTVLVRAKAWDGPEWCRLSELRRAPAEAPVSKVDVVVTLVDGTQRHGGLTPRAAFDLGVEVEADGCAVAFFETGTDKRVGPLKLARLAGIRL